MFQDLYTTFQALEAQAQRFDTVLLLSSGVGLLLVGLIIWLAGLAFSRVISAIIASVAACLSAFTLTGGRASAAILGAAIGLICGAILRRPVFALAAAILAASCTIVAVSEKTAFTPRISLTAPAENAPILAAGESWHRTCVWGQDFYKNTMGSAAKQAKMVYIYAAAAGAVAFVITIIVANVGAAVGCSAMGTLMSLMGLIVLLFYKGAQPVEFIAQRPLPAAAIFGGMIAFGTVIQLLLMRPRKGKIVTAPPKRLDEAVPVEEPKVSTISLKPGQ